MKLKILYLVHQFYPEFQSGTEKVVLNNAFMAQQSGNKVKVITYSLLATIHFMKKKIVEYLAVNFYIKVYL